MNVILCGYNWAGCKALDSLLNRGYKVFVYTHKSPWHIPSLESYCKKTNIAYSLENISSSDLPFSPDVICSIYYKYLIEKPVIDACQGKIFNLHPSLLPKYRGCSSVTWAMVNGEEEIGYTYHYINEDTDTGRIIYQRSIDIYEWDLQYTAYNRVMFEAMNSFEIALDLVLNGEVGKEQKGNSSYFKRGAPYSGKINPNWDSVTIERFIRAMVNPPLPPATYKGHNVRSYEEFLEIKDKIK